MSVDVVRAVAESLRDMFNGDLKELNGVFYIRLASRREEDAIQVYGEGERIYVKNLISKVSKEYLDYILGVVRENVDVEGGVEDGVLVLAFGLERATPERIVDAIMSILDAFSRDRPSDSIGVLGGFKIIFLGSTYSVVASDEYVCRFFSENFCTIPRDDGWFSSYIGMDNIYMPILAWRLKEKTLAYVPAEDGSLVVFDVSELLSKVRRLLELTNSSLKIESEADLFRKIQRLEEQLDIIRGALEGKTFPFVQMLVENPKIEEIRKLADEVSNGLKTLRRAISLSRFIEQKLLTRIVISIAKKMLKGETGVLSVATRKVSRLGAGYAVYISKEEARIAGLKDRVTVKVVAEEGEKPKLIIT